MPKRNRPVPPSSRAREEQILAHFQASGRLSDLAPTLGLSRQRLHQLKNRALRRTHVHIHRQEAV